jgi:hypothetical protein
LYIVKQSKPKFEANSSKILYLHRPPKTSTKNLKIVKIKAFKRTTYIVEKPKYVSRTKHMLKKDLR